jgi:hypothetical protein
MKKLLVALTALLVIHTNLNAQIINSEEKSSDKSVNCGGVERWAVKVLADAAVNTINFTPVNTAQSDALSALITIRDKHSDHQMKRAISAFSTQKGMIIHGEFHLPRKIHYEIKT